MSIYVCANPKCGHEFDDKDLEFIRCSYCGGKVLFKKTPPVVKKVKAV